MFTKFVLYVWWYILKCPILVTQSLYILHFSTHTFRWSKQPEPYVKAYKFLCKSDRYTSAKIFILDISGKPYLSGLAISRLLILLFQHQHINIHIRTLEILCVQLIFPIISPQIKNSIIYSSLFRARYSVCIGLRRPLWCLFEQVALPGRCIVRGDRTGAVLTNTQRAAARRPDNKSQKCQTWSNRSLF